MVCRFRLLLVPFLLVSISKGKEGKTLISTKDIFSSFFGWVPLLVGTVFVPTFEYFYGEGDTVKYFMIALLFFIALDWISGVRAAKKETTYMSKYGLDGAIRTFFILLLPAGGHFLDMAFNLPGVIFGALTMAILYHVLQSVGANTIRAGWGDYFPQWLFNRITDWVKSELEQKLQRSILRKIPDENVPVAVPIQPVMAAEVPAIVIPNQGTEDLKDENHN